MRCEAILFDFDGVIADTMPSHLSAWKRIIENEYHFPFQPMVVRLNEGRPAVEIAGEVFQNAGQDFTETQLQNVVEQKNALFRATHNAIVYPEIYKIIRLAREHGAKIGLVTGTTLENVQALLSRELLENFHIIITVGDAKRGKPFPDPYLEAAGRLGIDPEKCCVVENAPLGIQAAKSAGMFCVALKTTLSSEHLQAADVIFENHGKFLAQFRDLLLRR